ncbi:ABC transporter ATP-binding protein [Granulosicoccaceae sp. 1_MG-2023]|nr:ABC transporter ATP-binding protein [Granulosicoccaceae sp. 1_MG-2023]
MAAEPGPAVRPVWRAWQDCYALLNPAQRSEVRRWLVVSLLGRILVAFGVISVMPFVALISSPESLHSHPVLREAYLFSGLGSYQSFLLLVGGMTVAYYLLTAVFTCFEVWYGSRLSNRLERDFSSALYNGTLYQPYETHLRQDSAEQFELISDQAGGTIVGVLVNGIEILSNLVLACIITLLLMLVNFKAAISAALVLALAYTFIHLAFAPAIESHGRRLHQNKVRLLGLVRETLAGIREIKTYHAEAGYARLFRQLASANARLRTTHALLDFVPRQMLEALVFVGIVAFALLSMRFASEPGRVLPLIALYALAAYRLIPTLREIYAGLEMVNFAKHRVAILQARHKAIREPRSSTEVALPLDGEPLLRMQHISYTYPGEPEPVLRDINLTLQRKRIYALTGPSGSGKSTLIDLLVGLLTPQQGSICVAGRVLQYEDIPGWQKHIAYISQTITLFDGSLAANIAMQEATAQIDKARLQRVCAQAHLSEFIEALPQGLQTRVSADGKQLSGGQLRRLGIARALYRQPQLLILDESLNELESGTQQGILQMIRELEGLTVLIVSHDPRVLAMCDERIALRGNG